MFEKFLSLFSVGESRDPQTIWLMNSGDIWSKDRQRHVHGLRRLFVLRTRDEALNRIGEVTMQRENPQGLGFMNYMPSC